MQQKELIELIEDNKFYSANLGTYVVRANLLLDKLEDKENEIKP